MSIEKNHEECCGFEFEKNKFPFFGVLTLAYPLHLGLLLLALLTYPLKNLRLLGPIHNLLDASHRLIKKQSYMVRFKCDLAAFLLPRSRRMSKFLFSHFNFLILSFAWLLFFTIFKVVNAWI